MKKSIKCKNNLAKCQKANLPALHFVRRALLPALFYLPPLLL